MLAARQENVTTSLQPHNLQNRLHALCTSAMLQRYNLYSEKLLYIIASSHLQSWA